MTQPARSSERGAGVISTAAGLLVFLMFLLFAVQLLFALYASSTVTAVANDAVLRAAEAGAPDLALIEEQARRNLGRVGESATFHWETADTDADGVPDTVVLAVSADPPRFVPASVGDGVGLGSIVRTVRARIETSE